MLSNFDARSDVRSQARGHAVLRVGDARIPAEIVNISLGGALLQAVDGARVPDAGTRLSAELRLAGAERWLEADARVLRSDPPSATVAIEIVDVDPAFEDTVADVVLEGLVAADSPRVLLVDLDSDRRTRMSRLLRMRGCAPLEASTPLEAVRVCEQSSVPIAGAAVVDDGSQDLGELARFLARTYEGIEVTRIAPSQGRALGELRDLARAVHAARASTSAAP